MPKSDTIPHYAAVPQCDTESSRNILDEHLSQSVDALTAALDGHTPHIGIILGSGLNPLANEAADSIRIPYGDIPHMKTSTAASHVGQFVCGYIDGIEVLCMQGRLHGYEGNTPQEVAYPVWLMQRVGIDTLITTNAAGAINENYHVGDFCLMNDQINFTGRNPVACADAAGLADRFFSMADAFDPALRAIARDVADEAHVPLQEGVYVGLLGSSFETPAEIRMLRVWGADTVAMSVVEEVIAARQMGMRVMGISLVSNMACGIEGASPDGFEVLDVAKTREHDFSRLITGILAKL